MVRTMTHPISITCSTCAHRDETSSLGSAANTDKDGSRHVGGLAPHRADEVHTLRQPFDGAQDKAQDKPLAANGAFRGTSVMRGGEVG